MKRFTIALSPLLVCLVFLTLGTSQRVFGQRPDIRPISGGDRMPAWPIPDKPIPHHEPGQPARTGNASYQTSRLNALGEVEDVELRGLDALLANGAMTDPLQGNYRLLGLDKLMFSSYAYATTNDFRVRSYELVTPTLNEIPNSSANYGNVRFNAIAAGDLNGDLVDEQIAAWVDRADRRIYMNIGEMPTSFGKTTSAPVIIAHPGGTLDVLVRGYDDALWQTINWSGSWDDWNNDAGGVLFSSPAAVLRATGEVDVFAIGLDNQVYHQHYSHSGTGWGDWNLVDGEGHFPAARLITPLPAIPPPAAAARGGSQLDLFRLGPDNTLWWCHSDDGVTWGSWSNLGGMLASGPGAISLGDGRMQVYALGMDGALWYLTYEDNWSDWMRLETPDGVAGNAFPVLTSPATGQVTVYLAGTENRVWEAHFNGSTWENWTSIPVPGGGLGAGIGAAIGPDGAYLVAQMRDGSLQYSLNTSGWTSMDGLPVSTISTNRFVTSAVTKTLPDDYALENAILDLTTGYFTGDGREQVVLAYEDASECIRLEIYDMSDGFRLARTAQLAAPIFFMEDWPRVAAGDVDGDGVDEIGLVSVQDWAFASRKLILRVFRIEKNASGEWTGDLAQISYKEVQIDEGGDIYAGWPFGGTLRIEAGDIIPETVPTEHNDEFAVVSDWRHDELLPLPSSRAIRAGLHLYDHQATEQFRSHKWDTFEATGTDYWSELYATGVGLAVGNVDEHGTDEIVVTWPVEFEGHDYPDLRRDLQVYRYNSGTLDKISYWTVHDGEYSRYTFLDTLAVGDLDQDLADEIVMVNHWFRGSQSGPYYYLNVLEYDGTDSLNVLYQTPLTFADLPRAFNLAMGDFTGESVRVGPPNYRVQRKMTSPVVFLNLPPMHRDIIAGTVLSVDNGASAIHSAENTEEDASTTESKREWSLSTGFEMSVGAFGGKVTTSLDNTYEEDFCASTARITEVSFSDETTAQFHDQVIYNATDYAVWEYPVYGAEADNPNEAQTISVVWPLVDATTGPANMYGSWCDEDFYAPSHQPYNVWSYDPIGPGQFADLDRTIASKPTAGGTDLLLEMTDTTGEERSASFHNQISAGLEYSYESEFEIPLIGKAWDFSFRAYANGSYGSGEISTLSTQFTEASTVRVDFPDSSDPGAYAITAYMYWAQAGYLVVDYQTQPDPGAVPWNIYNQPDPALILPWYGFPDPAAPVAPPCGNDRQLFTHDIKLAPAYIQNGETVTMTATVRNFSAQSLPSDLTVHFYLGYPATGNQIGTCIIGAAALNRSNGPQQCFDTWVVNGGSGEEKIYARLDPGDRILEMHDEGDAIDNNTGYGLLHVASADYYDPGLRNERVYQSILYEAAPGLGFGLYLPTANMTETLRYELIPSVSGDLEIVGDPIQILAFRGGSQPPENSHSFGSIPAGLMAFYRDVDLPPGLDEANLKLYRLEGSVWVEATCPGYSAERFPADNRIAVPVCQTGTFVLSAETPAPEASPVFLPLVSRNAP